jgi:hypothetical protein
MRARPVDFALNLAPMWASPANFPHSPLERRGFGQLGDGDSTTDSVGATVGDAVGATDAGADGGAELVGTDGADGDGDGPACWPPPRKSHHNRTSASATSRTATIAVVVLFRRY